MNDAYLKFSESYRMEFVPLHSTLKYLKIPCREKGNTEGAVKKNTD